MATVQIEVESRVIELSTEAFKVFCDNISGVFGVDMECEQQGVAAETLAGLKKRFKKLTAVNVVDSKGLLDGTFQFVFDQEGLFTLGGVIVMLPEERIMANRKDASAELAERMVDAVGEVGNLLVESWDRVFREGLDGHGQFLHRLPAFVGEPWGKPEEKIGLARDEELVFVPYKMTIGSFPAFNCGVVFPKIIFSGDSKSDTETAASTEEKGQREIQDQQALSDSANPEQSDKAQEPDGGASEPQAPVADEEEVAAPKQDKKSVVGNVSETIQKMAQSPAVLPGEPGQSTIAEKAATNETGKLLGMCARDIMQRDVVWASPEDSVQQALAKMQQNDVGYIMIGHDGVLEAIVSRSDIAGAISPYLRPIFAKWRGPSDDATLHFKIKWIMSRPVRTARPKTPLAAIMENMCRFGGRALPVVDRQGKVLGLVTIFDIFRKLLNTGADVSTAGKSPQGPPLA